MLIGCIEAGGTKFVCGICEENGTIVDRLQFPTTTPRETMPQVIQFLKNWDIKAIGLGCFGPLDLNINSETYGYITTTPKTAWTNFNIVGEIKKYFDVPIGFDTDVNGAALGEAYFGCAQNLKNVLYITIGTGIGAGALVEGNLVHGLLHPEMGHILIKKHPDDLFVGICPYHKNCLEGLASGPAIEKRYHKKGHELTDPKVWELEAYYLAQALMNYILILSPEKIILGGGVSKQQLLLTKVREYVIDMLNGYIQHEILINHIDEYIVNPELGDNAGLIGALSLGLHVLKRA